MATMTLAQVQTIIASLVTAYTSLASGTIDSYSISGRTLTRRDLAALREEIQEWSAMEAQLSGTGATNHLLGRFGDSR